MKKMHSLLKLAVVVSMSSAASAWATSPLEILESYRQQARTEQADFVEFSIDRGRQFFNDTHANDWSCATCHTADPTAAGKHDRTAKVIEPLAPAANSKRFTRTKKTEKWFRRNCKDVLERECTASEKGDVLSYLLSVKK